MLLINLWWTTLTENHLTFARVVEPVDDLTQFADLCDGEASSDLLMAQMLQHEYDKEHDLMLKIEENHVNKASRGEWWGGEIILALY